LSGAWQRRQKPASQQAKFPANDCSFAYGFGSREFRAPQAQIKKVFLPHRRPGSFSSEKEALA